MKYKHYLTLAALAIGNTLLAQTAHQVSITKYTHSILAKQTTQNIAAKGSSARERIIASASRLDNGMGGFDLIDTNHYKYTGVHGNVLDNNNMYSYMDNGNDFMFDGIIDPPGSLLYDTATVVANAGTGIYPFRLVKKYNANNELTSFNRVQTDQTGTILQERFLYTYNASHKCSYTEWQQDMSPNVSGAFVKIFTRSSKFDTQNRLVADSFYDYSAVTPDQKMTYAYSGAGNVQQFIHYYWDFNNGTGWIPDSMSTYAYDGNNRLVSAVQQGWNGTTYVNSIKDTFAYTGAAATVTWGKHFYWSAGAYVPSWMSTTTLTPALWADTMKGYTYNGTTFVLQGITKNQYTALNHISHQYLYPVVNGVIRPQPDDKLDVYYEAYNDATAVSGPSGTRNTITLFPNPAKDEVHLQFGVLPAHAPTVSIYSFDGRLVQQTILPLQLKSAFSTRDLVPGNYLVEVIDGNERQDLRMNVVR